MFEIDEVDDAITRLGELCSLTVVTRSEKGSTLVVDGDALRRGRRAGRQGRRHHRCRRRVRRRFPLRPDPRHGHDRRARRSAPRARRQPSSTLAPVPPPISARCSNGVGGFEAVDPRYVAFGSGRNVSPARSRVSSSRRPRFHRRRRGRPVQRSRHPRLRNGGRPRRVPGGVARYGWRRSRRPCSLARRSRHCHQHDHRPTASPSTCWCCAMARRPFTAPTGFAVGLLSGNRYNDYAPAVEYAVAETLRGVAGPFRTFLERGEHVAPHGGCAHMLGC